MLPISVYRSAAGVVSSLLCSPSLCIVLPQGLSPLCYAPHLCVSFCRRGCLLSAMLPISVYRSAAGVVSSLLCSPSLCIVLPQGLSPLCYAPHLCVSFCRRGCLLSAMLPISVYRSAAGVVSSLLCSPSLCIVLPQGFLLSDTSAESCSPFLCVVLLQGFISLLSAPSLFPISVYCSTAGVFSSLLCYPSLCIVLLQEFSPLLHNYLLSLAPHLFCIVLLRGFHPSVIYAESVPCCCVLSCPRGFPPLLHLPSLLPISCIVLPRGFLISVISCESADVQRPFFLSPFNLPTPVPQNTSHNPQDRHTYYICVLFCPGSFSSLLSPVSLPMYNTLSFSPFNLLTPVPQNTSHNPQDRHTYYICVLFCPGSFSSLLSPVSLPMYNTLSFSPFNLLTPVPQNTSHNPQDRHTYYICVLFCPGSFSSLLSPVSLPMYNTLSFSPFNLLTPVPQNTSHNPQDRHTYYICVLFCPGSFSSLLSPASFLSVSLASPTKTTELPTSLLFVWSIV